MKAYNDVTHQLMCSYLFECIASFVLTLSFDLALTTSETLCDIVNDVIDYSNSSGKIHWYLLLS